MRCPSCRKPVDPEAAICLECGESLDAKSSAAPPSPQSQLVQRVVSSRPEPHGAAPREDAETRAPGKPAGVDAAPTIVWRAPSPAAAPHATPLVGPEAVQKPRRRASEESVRCRGCGVMSDAEAARCRNCGERLRHD